MLHALDEARTETEATLARQREFVADASHELRTPLTSVLANLELLEETLHGRAARGRRLRAALLAAACAGWSPTCCCSRARTPGREPPHRPVDLSSVVTDAASELEPVAGDHEISISAPSGAGDRGRARRAAPARAEPDGERAAPHRSGDRGRGERRAPATATSCSRSRTTGPGIPAELREKVFERFFRAHGDRSGSSGLGLAIVKAVAESHQGSVTLEPPLDGRGARFVVRFPARDERQKPSSRSAAAADAQEDMSDITSQQLVVFSIGSEEYALPIGAVHEIIRFTEPRSVASDVPWIRGVIGLRGKIIPIYDLASRMGIAGRREPSSARSSSSRPAPARPACVVGDVEEVLTVTSDQLEAVPTADTQTIESIAKIGDRLVILLNPEGLFARQGADELAAA